MEQAAVIFVICQPEMNSEYNSVQLALSQQKAQPDIFLWIQKPESVTLQIPWRWFCLCEGKLGRYMLVDLVLENIEVVGGSHGDDVLWWVPGCVKDFFTEI